jgi:hypothetical protein
VVRGRSAIALAQILGRTAGRAAASRATPLYLGLLLVAGTIFGGNGMAARELTLLADHQAVGRLVLLALWLVPTLPVARALLVSPSARFVRVYPVSWITAAVLLAAGLALVEGPWIALWLAGDGLIGGLAAGIAAMTGHALLIGRPRRWYEVVAALGWLGGLAIGTRSWGLFGVAALALGLRRSWIGVHEPRYRGEEAMAVPRQSALALAVCYLAVLLRRERPLLWRWALAVLLGMGIATLAIRNNQVTEPDHVLAVSLAVMSPTLVFGALGVGGAVMRVERHARWLLEVSATSRPVRLLGAALALAGCGAAAGLIHGSVVALSTTTRLRVVLSSVGAGALLSAACALVARWTSRSGEEEGRRALRASVVLGGLVSYLAAAFTEVGVLLAVVSTAALCALAVSERDITYLPIRDEGD